jgi:hypothetical protein
MAESSRIAELLATVESNGPADGQPPDQPPTTGARDKGKGRASAAYTFKQYKIHAALIKIIQQKCAVVHTMASAILDADNGRAHSILSAIMPKQQDKY